MKPIRSRQMILLLVAFAVGTAGLLVPDSSDAAQQLFRIERKFFGAPFPAVPNGPESPYGDPGGAGRYIVYVEPYTSLAPAVADVQAGNPVGSPFTLPAKFIDFQGTYTNTAKTAFPGYTSISALDYFNGVARFKPNNGAAGPTRVVFPTTGGNPTPNIGGGNPVNATTTFSGRYDFDRAGSLNVTPGPNRFGGTMRFLYGPAASFYQYIYYFAPLYYKAYGSFYCKVGGGVACTLSSAGTTIGEITSSGMVTRYLLNVKGTGTTTLSPLQSKNKAKATTPTTANGSVPTPQGNASFLVAKNYYLHLNHPWTTGNAEVYNILETPSVINPQYAGYDISLSGGNITITRIGTSAMFNKTLTTVTYTNTTYKQYLTGVRRVVSLVRPRLLHVYQHPVDNNDPIISNFQAARLWTMKVFFVPEPAGIAMIGTGFAFLVGMYSIRRR